MRKIRKNKPLPPSFWSNLRQQVESKEVNIAQLARSHNLPLSTLRGRMRREGWQRFKAGNANSLPDSQTGQAPEQTQQKQMIARLFSAFENQVEALEHQLATYENGLEQETSAGRSNTARKNRRESKPNVQTEQKMKALIATAKTLQSLFALQETQRKQQIGNGTTKRQSDHVMRQQLAKRLAKMHQQTAPNTLSKHPKP
ncbi:hypothetical protein [Polycladidibacter stylochi]|uniref:hypothetical protein n=1 Tax=Polycladidibacter stylochi TaxID=1807766 RepID=UPI0008322FD6|nr:hypothetical protein [Pseudovibrio stylochi]